MSYRNKFFKLTVTRRSVRTPTVWWFDLNAQADQAVQLCKQNTVLVEKFEGVWQGEGPGPDDFVSDAAEFKNWLYEEGVNASGPVRIMPQLYKSKAGGFVEVHEEKDGAVYFSSQGGGMLRSCRKEHFDATFLPAEKPVTRRALVTAEFLLENSQEVRLPCWSDGMAWNGWGMPAFPRDSVDKLIGLLDVDPHIPKMRWAENGEDVVYEDGEEDAQGNPVPTVMPPVVMPDGTHAWPIGAGSWCWDSVMFPEDCTPEALEREWGKVGQYPSLARSVWRDAVGGTLPDYWAWVSRQLLEEMA